MPNFVVPAQMFPSIQSATPVYPAAVNLPQPSSGISSPDLHVRWIDIDDLQARKPAWHFLAQNALQTNPTFETNYLLPALTHLASEAVQVIVVENRNAPEGQELVALVPIETKQVFRMPFKTAEVWRHDQCFNATPLLDKDYAAEAWLKLCDFLVSNRYSMLSLDTVSAAPEVDAVFQSLEQQPGVTRFQRDHFLRAGFAPAVSADNYISQHVSKGTRKKLRSRLSKLEQVGDVTWERSTDESDFEQLTEDFLRLEATSWKGEAGTALACSQSTQSFYRDLIQRSAAQGKAKFLVLKVDGKPIAMISDIQSQATVYCYKTSYDDSYARYSPGLQTEFKNIEYLHREGVQFGDSCTAAGKSAMSRIWGQRLAFQKVIFSLKPGFAQTAVRAFPTMQSVLKRLRNMKPGKSKGTHA